MATMPNTESGSKSLGSLKSASELTDKLDKLKSGRQNLEAQWKLNMAFYKGKQYTYFNRSLKRLESLPIEDGEKPRYRVRLVNNQINPGVHSLLAKLTKTKPVMYATPTSGSDADLKAAELADKLLEHWWTDLALDDKLSEALLWSIVTGQGYWKITWDEHAGKSMRFLMDPNSGQPITDSALEDLYRAELQKAGIEEQALEKVVYLGDIHVEAISPFDIYLDDTAKTFDECKFAICTTYLSPEEIKKRWKVDVEADSTDYHTDESPGLSAGLKRVEPNVKAVHTGYFLPTPELPNGRYVIWVGDSDILEDEAWNYPFSVLPFVKFPALRVPGQIYDMGDVEPAIPIQKDLNKTLSQIVEYKNLTLKPRVWAPTGALQGVRLTSEPGVVYEYNPMGGEKPTIEQLPSLPPYVFEHLNLLRQSLREAFGIVDITEGTPPPNVEAGIAIDLLQEMATDRLAPRLLLLERVLSKAGDLMLKYAKTYYQEPRLLKIAGSGSSSKRFMQSDLEGGVNITVETGSALPRTRAGRQARILEYVDRGVLRPDQAYKYLDIADLEGLSAQFKADEDHAYREHDRMIAGKPVNPLAAQTAIQQVQTGQAMDPNTGQPIMDPQQAQAYIHNESLRPFPFENYEAHIQVHATFMKSPEFEKMPPNVQNDFVTHYNLTVQALMSIPKPVEFQAVRPTLQIKATAGPTPVAKILEKAGLTDLTPQDMSEPPLETWVTDSMDKPDQDDAGNDPLSQADLVLKQQEYQAKVADAALRSGKAQVDLGHQQHAHEQSHMHDAQMHEQKVREAAAKAALAEKKLEQSDFRPKAKPGSK